MSELPHEPIPLFSERKLRAMSKVEFSKLVIMTRLRGLRGKSHVPAPEYVEVLAQLKRHIWERATGSGPRSVYFAAADDDVVKIGLARDPAKRIATLQTSHPKKLALLLVLPGGRDLEQRLHARFARYRVGGEWFRREGHLRNFIESQLAKAGRSP